jgi:hypothetical protein
VKKKRFNENNNDMESFKQNYTYACIKVYLYKIFFASKNNIKEGNAGWILYIRCTTLFSLASGI